jgi:hypothetical protein
MSCNIVDIETTPTRSHVDSAVDENAGRCPRIKLFTRLAVLVRRIARVLPDVVSRHTSQVIASIYVPDTACVGVEGIDSNTVTVSAQERDWPRAL